MYDVIIELEYKQGLLGGWGQSSEPGLRNSDCPEGNPAAEAFLERWQLWRLEAVKDMLTP